LSDLGLALLGNTKASSAATESRRQLDEHFNLACAPRYAAPEVLAGDINTSSSTVRKQKYWLAGVAGGWVGGQTDSQSNDPGSILPCLLLALEQCI
jgi:hypothetical protein